MSRFVISHHTSNLSGLGIIFQNRILGRISWLIVHRTFDTERDWTFRDNIESPRAVKLIHYDITRKPSPDYINDIYLTELTYHWIWFLFFNYELPCVWKKTSICLYSHSGLGLFRAGRFIAGDMWIINIWIHNANILYDIHCSVETSYAYQGVHRCVIYYIISGVKVFHLRWNLITTRTQLFLLWMKSFFKPYGIWLIWFCINATFYVVSLWNITQLAQL